MSGEGLRLRDETSERRVVGLILAHAPGVERAMRMLGPEHFTVPAIRKLFEASKTFAPRPSSDTVLHKLDQDGEDLDEFSALVERVGRSAERSKRDLSYYVECLQLREQARKIFWSLEGRGDDPGITGLLEDDDVAQVRERLRALASTCATSVGEAVDHGSYFQSFKERRREIREIESAPADHSGILTGIGFLDVVMGGLHQEEFGLIVGRTGEGKSTILVHLAVEALMQFKMVCYVTIEMPRRSIEHMVDSRLSRVDRDKFRRAHERRLTREDKAAWKRSVLREKKRRRNVTSDLWTLDLPNYCTAADIEAYVDEAESEFGAPFDLILVDHLGLMSPVNDQKGGRLSWDSMAEISNDLKFLCRRRQTRCWAGVQAKSGSGSSASTRKSGDLDNIGLSYLISQPADAAVVMIKDDQEFDAKGIIRLRLAKYRYGAVGAHPVTIDYSTCTVSDYEEDDDG